MKIVGFALCCLLFLALPLSAEKPKADGSQNSFESGRGSRVSWARLKFHVTGFNPNGNADLGWFYHPTGDVRLVEWLRKNTDINIKEEWNVVDVEELDQMCDFPMLFLSGKGEIDLTLKQKNNLREYLDRGGFLFVDDCVALRQPREDVFFNSMLKLMREIYPEIELKQLPMSHPVFHCYYEIRRWPHAQGVNHGLWAGTVDGRMVMLMSASDLHCAWTGFHFSWALRQEAFKVAANIYVYIMAN